MRVREQFAAVLASVPALAIVPTAGCAMGTLEPDEVAERQIAGDPARPRLAASVGSFSIADHPEYPDINAPPVTEQRAAGLQIRLDAAASPGAIISPISATIDAGGVGFGSINNTLDQSGLTAGFTSGVTDFDTYLATTPRHTMIFAGFEWFSDSGTTAAVVTYDLGAAITIDRLALWNEESSGIGTLDLLSSTDGVTFTPLASGLHPTDNALTSPIDSPPYSADVFTFARTSARFVRLAASGCPQPDPGSFPACAIGEVAFRVGSPPVLVTKADIRTNTIDVLLSPTTDSGQFVLTLVGDTNTVLFQGTRAGGSYHFNFGPSQGALSGLPEGQFTQVRADWTVSGTTETASATVAFRVLGEYRHSQYNIPDEASCPGGSARAWITDAQCNFTQTTLRASFIAQANLNGSGTSIQFGGIQREQFCLARQFNPPPGAQNHSFRPGVSSGTCNVGLGNNTVARNRNHPFLSCNDEVLIVGLGAPGTIKTVTDECPACPERQLDNFTTASACAPGAIPDLGRFTTIRLR